MSRPPLYTPQEFLAHYRQSSSVQDLADRLHLSHVSVYKWLKVYHLPKLDHRPKRSIKMLRQLQWWSSNQPLQELAAQHRLSIPAIKYHLRRAIHYLFDAPNPPKKIQRLSRPIFLHEIPLFNWLIIDITLRHRIPELHERTNVPIPQIDLYLQRVQEARYAYTELHPLTKYPNPRPTRGRRANPRTPFSETGL